MPTFDIVSRFNFPELDNAINNTQKAVQARFDFRGATAEITVDKKEKRIKFLADDAMKMRGLIEMFESAAHRRGLDLKSFDYPEPEPALAGKLKCEAKIRDGIEQETAKFIVKMIKDSKIKVQASIQGEEIRVSGKQIDDLQAVIAMLKAAGASSGGAAAQIKIPLQFVNMKS
jgi:uncharacterized protein YajQ (UPF0234 family)